MRRGEVWWATLPLPAGRRPVVLVSRDSGHAVRASVTVVEVTATIRGIPSEVPLSRRDGLPRQCVANTDTLVTIRKAWLDTRISMLDHDKVELLNDALLFSLGLRP